MLSLHITFLKKQLPVKNIFIYLAVSGMIFSCTPKNRLSDMNPFLQPYSTPFEVPPFDQIQNEHYLPAFEQGMIDHNAEIQSIVSDAQAPTFNNTIEALDAGGGLLRRVSWVFFNVKEAHTNPEMDKIAETIAPKLSQHTDAIYLNEKLFERVSKVYNGRDQLDLTPEQQRLLSETYKTFVRGGANLSQEKKEELKKINEQLALLELKFSQNMLAETNAYQMVIENKDDLAGLPESVIAAAADAAKAAGQEGKWVFTLHKPSWIPFLTYSENRELREKLYKAMYNRANNNNEHDNKQLIRQITDLRIQKAQIMEFDNWASFILDNNMAKTPENVYDLLYKVWTPALARAKDEAKDMQDMIDREGKNFELASWDWWYYAEKVRKEKYDLDEEQLRPYFELNNVRDGVFMVAQKLFGLSFSPLHNMPVFHPECEVFEVKDEDGSHIGVLYMDYYPRASKSGGAWMTNYREQHYKDGKNIRPVISVTCNFSKPTGDKPALLSYDEVETLFHEFGHALHGLLSQCHYISLAGTNVSRDFVELPSQIMEHWASQPEVLKMYARHYQTGETIPQELIDKMEKSGKFNQGFITTEFVAAAILDMDYHTLTQPLDIEVETFENKSMQKAGLIEQIIPRYKSTYFAHIFPGGYSSGYYSYLWAEVLDADAFEAFLEAGDIFHPETAKAFRTHVLEKGGTEEPMKLYLHFRGKEPGIEPLLKNRGLL